MHFNSQEFIDERQRYIEKKIIRVLEETVNQYRNNAGILTNLLGFISSLNQRDAVQCIRHLSSEGCFFFRLFQFFCSRGR